MLREARAIEILIATQQQHPAASFHSHSNQQPVQQSITALSDRSYRWRQEWRQTPAGATPAGGGAKISANRGDPNSSAMGLRALPLGLHIRLPPLRRTPHAHSRSPQRALTAMST